MEYLEIDAACHMANRILGWLENHTANWYIDRCRD